MMKQDRDGISLAHRAALRFAEVVRPLSVAAVVFSAAFLAATAGTSYAKLHKAPNCPNEDSCTENLVVIGNNGAITGGNYEVFAPGAKKNTQQLHQVKGTKSALAGVGVSGVAITNDGTTIAVAAALGNYVAIFGSGADGNSSPSALLTGGTPSLLANPAGVTFLPDNDLVVSNTLTAVPAGTTGICAAPPAGAGLSLGSIVTFTAGTNTVSNTITGCDTFLLGPTGVAVDAAGNTWVVNSLGGFITGYEAGATGDAAPINLIAGGGVTVGGAEFVAVGVAGTEIYVTDANTNSVSIFDTTTAGGTLLGVISGNRTKFRSPMGIAFDGDDLYVANNRADQFEEFDDDDGTLDLGGNIRPTVVVRGPHTNLQLPVGLAVLPNAPVVTPASAAH